MPTGFDEKLKRLKLIKNMVKKEPCDFEEIYQKLLKYKIKERMAQKYLQELCELGVLSYSKENGKYRIKEPERLVFSSKPDYETYLNHCRQLCLSSSEHQRYDQMSPWAAIDFLALREQEHSAEDKCFVEHLKSGYPEIYIDLQKYRQLAAELQYSGIDESFTSKSKKDKQKIEELEKLHECLIGKIYHIVGALPHGIPLKGSCDYCPDIKIRIEGG
jgi:hypothetical protein